PQGGAPGGGGTQQGGAPAGGGAQQGGAAAADEVYLDEATEERIRRQAGGDYGEVARTTGVPLGATQDAWGRPFENMASGQVSPGVVRFQWSP
ncbi:hypothetical protein KQH42_30340, partial [Streptomyces sp. CHA1]|uniref:hypothetical protein n=1 Tax=Streptomyces sp. CHA1 TaxID=2841663 RepID=UPI002095615A